jgi:triosephosphate isomerase
VNFKTYLEATGKRSVELAVIADKVSREKGVGIGIAPQFTDIKSVSEKVEIPVFSQHIDSVKPGAFTGHVLAEAVKAAGATGTLLNHSERRITASEIEVSLRLANEADLLTLVCAETSDTGRETARLAPTMIAIEPPDLIGSGISVSKARPELITSSLQAIREINPTVKVLCGAGITTSGDVSRALELGAEGVLVASSIVKSRDPARLLGEMADAVLKAK